MRYKKVLVFGIDGLDFALLRQWTGEGYLPNFSKLLAESIRVPLDNAPRLGEMAWPTFYSGLNAGSHGRYFNSQIVSGSYDTRPFSLSEFPLRPYWEDLDRLGMKVIVVDVPKSGLSPLANGIQIVNWASHDQETDVGYKTSPGELASELDRRYGSDPVAANDYGGRGPKDFDAFQKSFEKNVQRRTRLVLDFVKNRQWDHFIVVYDDMHSVSHYAWHIHDVDHPDHDSALRQRIGDPLLRVCSAIDRAFGQLRHCLDNTVGLQVLCPTGIGPNYHATAALDEALRHFQGHTTVRAKPVNTLRSIWRRIPLRWQNRLLPLQNSVRNALLGSDRRRREAFTLPASDEAGAIRINLVGREPCGRIRAGDEYEDYIARLCGQLKSLYNLDTGNPVVSDIYRVADYCWGKYLHHLPDLVVVWNCSEPIRAIAAQGIGPPIALPKWNSRTGSHRGTGMLMIATPGQSSQEFRSPVRYFDLAPTLCDWLGVCIERFQGESFAPLLERRQQLR